MSAKNVRVINGHGIDRREMEPFAKQIGGKLCPYDDSIIKFEQRADMESAPTMAF